jgi:hypothetical protein
VRKGGGEGTGGASACPTAGRGLFGGGLSEEVAEGEISKGHGRCYTARVMLGAKKSHARSVAVRSGCVVSN